MYRRKVADIRSRRLRYIDLTKSIHVLIAFRNCVTPLRRKSRGCRRVRTINANYRVVSIRGRKRMRILHSGRTKLLSR